MPTNIIGDPNNFPASFDVASDGDAPDAGPSIQVGFQALADRTRWLRTHGLIYTHEFAEHDDSLATAFAAWATTTSYANPTPATAMRIDITGVRVTDAIQVDLSASALFANPGGSPDLVLFRLVGIDDLGVTNVAHPTDSAAIVEAPDVLQPTISFSITGRYMPTVAGTTRLKIQARSLNFTTQVRVKSYCMRIQQVR